MRIRQVALVARELEPALEELCAVFGLEVCYRDPGVEVFGLENGLMPVGDTFLEVVSPVREGTSAGRLLDRRGGDGGYMVIVQDEDLAAHRRRLQDLGVRIVWEATLPDIATVHLHPRDVGAAILSLDVADPPESWRWAGPDWQARVRTGLVDRIVGVELQGSDPVALAQRWAQVLDRPARSLPDGTQHIDLEGGALRFVPDRDGRGEGVSGVELRVVDRPRLLDAAASRGLAVGKDGVEVCGTRFRLA